LEQHWHLQEELAGYEGLAVVDGVLVSHLLRPCHYERTDW
jgi:hypothetical protein